MNPRVSNASVFAMAMVVAIHTAGRPLKAIENGTSLWWFEAFGHYGVFLIAVPFFFICSGYFLAGHMEEHGWWLREGVKRMRTLLVPYLIWSLVYAFLPFAVFLMANLAHGRIAIMEMTLGRAFWMNTLGLYPCNFPTMAQLWYVRALMMFVLISPVLHLAIRNFFGGVLILYVVSLVHGVWATFFPNNGMILFFSKFYRLEGLLYFTLGIWLRGMHATVEEGISMPSWPKSMLAVAGAIFVGLALLATSIFIQICYGLNLLPVMRLLFVPPLLYAFWRLVPKCQFPKWLTSSSFAIFLIHTIIWRTIGFIRPIYVSSTREWFAKWVLGFFGSMAIALAMRKCCPRVTRIVFGGR